MNNRISRIGRLLRLETRDCPTAGTLDTTFGGTGIATVVFGAYEDSCSAMAIQDDGKIILAGGVNRRGKSGSLIDSDFALARLNADGSLDATFGAGGKVRTDFGTFDRASSVAVQSDGKIVVAGVANSKYALGRYNANGTLDTSFDGDGKLITSLPGNATGSAYDMLIDADGRIVVCGSWSVTTGKGQTATTTYGCALIRYQGNGTLDNSFDGDGIAVSGLSSSSARVFDSLAIQNDGRIIVGGYIDGESYLARHNPNGMLDTTFGGGDGHVELAASRSWQGVGLQSERIIVVGHTPPYLQGRPVLAGYDFTGQLDPSFGTNGVVEETNVSVGQYRDVEIQADGKIVVCGAVSGFNLGFAVARYSADGMLDTSFGGDGIVVVSTTTQPSEGASDVEIQADGRIVSAGTSNDMTNFNSFFRTIRLEGDDTVVPGMLFGGPGYTSTTNPLVLTPIPLPTTQVFVGGPFSDAEPDDQWQSWLPLPNPGGF